jgi:putative Mg2+ transporter-C (MgtC) family protein
LDLYPPFDTAAFARTALALALAFGLGGLIGFERQWRQRTAGLRTNVLVAVGAAAFVDLGGRVAGAAGGANVIAYVVTGIGFLGAGVIMKEGAQVRGINTAATLWASAAVGAFAGAGRLAEAALVTAFVLAGNTLLRPVVSYIQRRPVTAETEATYKVHLVCKPEQAPDARELLAQELARHNYPVREIETVTESEDVVELEAILATTNAEPRELDMVTAHLEADPMVEAASWTVSAEG